METESAGIFYPPVIFEWFPDTAAAKFHFFPGLGQFLGPTLSPHKQNSGICGRECGITTAISLWTGT